MANAACFARHTVPGCRVSHEQSLFMATMAAFQPALNALRSSGDLCLSAGGVAGCCGGLVFGAGAAALGGAVDVVGCSTGSGFGSCQKPSHV